MKNIILTGFSPFGKYNTNFSSQLLKLFSNSYEGFSIIKKVIPVSWNRSIKTYKTILSTITSKPLFVILLGIHSDINFHIEKLAWNFKIGRDNDRKFQFGFIKLFFPLWLKTIVNLNKLYLSMENQTKFSISYFAGYYLCNYLYYWALLLSKNEYPVIFIHVPDKGDINDYVKKVEMILRILVKLY